MNLIRLIVIGLIIYLLIRAFKRWQANKVSMQNQDKDPEKLQQDMVACKLCDLHVPEDEALKKNGQYYCCQEHLDQDKD